MKLIATMPVRNEAWIIGLSARVALQWCDELCIGNHASTDRTGDILGELQFDFPGRVHVVSYPETVWTEMQHRQTLLEMARIHRATHIAIVDADEILTGNSPARELIDAMNSAASTQLPLASASTKPASRSAAHSALQRAASCTQSGQQPPQTSSLARAASQP